MQVTVDGRRRTAVIIGGTAVNSGFKLLDNAQYPHIVSDYERTFRVLKSLPADIPLGAHGSYFEMEEKYQRMTKGDGTAFIDPEGYKQYVASAEKAFLDELAKQRAASRDH
jgi:metallo-beta-lactamase class B